MDVMKILILMYFGWEINFISIEICFLKKSVKFGWLKSFSSPGCYAVSDIYSYFMQNYVQVKFCLLILN